MAAGVLPQTEEPYSTLVNSHGHAAHTDGNSLQCAFWRLVGSSHLIRGTWTLKDSDFRFWKISSVLHFRGPGQVLFMACAFCLTVWSGRILYKTLNNVLAFWKEVWHIVFISCIIILGRDCTFVPDIAACLRSSRSFFPPWLHAGITWKRLLKFPGPALAVALVWVSPEVPRQGGMRSHTRYCWGCLSSLCSSELGNGWKTPPWPSWLC